MLRIKKIDFIKSVSNIKDLPDTAEPEIAFIGRSNVGKSSLINDLCNKKVAHTSSTPGKTQLINFFLINESFYLIDLPGYGYAKTSKSQKKTWSSLLENYLQNSPQLKAIIFLLDIRRTPNEHDIMMNNWLKKLNNIQTFYILTKKDKLSNMQAGKQKKKIAIDLFVDVSDFMFYSVTKNIGKVELLKKIESIVG